MRKPRIAIPEINQNVRNYTRALTAAGMEPVVISVTALNIEEAHQQEYLDYSAFQVDLYDGLLIPGGVDINPARYDEPVRGSVGISDDLDELQLNILDRFVKQGKPVLGICRGHQLLNVYFGGSLIQHLPTYLSHNRTPELKDRVHGCVAAEGSWLERLYGNIFTHNSAHHQAVNRLGEGLVIDSRCPVDGTVEGMHHTSLPVIGVQWHPERTCLDWRRAEVVDGLEIFRYFNHLCLTYALMHGRPGDLDAGRYVSEDLWV